MPPLEADGCCRAVVDSSRIFSGYRDGACLLRVRELPIDRMAIQGWSRERKYLYGRKSSKRTESLRGLEQAD